MTILDIKGKKIENITAFCESRPETEWHIEASISTEEYYLIGE